MRYTHISVKLLEIVLRSFIIYSARPDVGKFCCFDPLCQCNNDNVLGFNSVASFPNKYIVKKVSAAARIRPSIVLIGTDNSDRTNIHHEC